MSDPARRDRLTQRVGLTGATEENTAAGLYGIIISAAVMASSHAASAARLILAVVITLVIYWSAERYARLVAERIHEGHPPAWPQIRSQFTRGWQMVTASALPVIVLAVVRAAGAALQHAVVSALICATLLLCLAGWEMGRLGRLSGLERLASAAVAGTFGVVLILLKMALH
jgi:hypothetical protein